MGHDVAKISEAISRPGIDPRKFVDLAVVTTVAVAGDGVHADVTTVDGMHETAALTTPYGGAGYGFYAPIQLDDFVLLAVPDGKYNAGARIIGRIWDPGSPPPAEVTAHPEDVALVVRPGQTIRIVVSGGGDIVLTARDGGKILAGDDDADDPVMRKSDVAAFIANYYASHTHVVAGVQTGSGAVTSAIPLLTAQAPSGSPILFTK